MDIFAAFGTMLTVAERFNRIHYEIELRKKFCYYLRSHLTMKENVIQGDALKVISMVCNQITIRKKN